MSDSNLVLPESNKQDGSQSTRFSFRGTAQNILASMRRNPLFTGWSIFCPAYAASGELGLHTAFWTWVMGGALMYRLPEALVKMGFSTKITTSNWSKAAGVIGLAGMTALFSAASMRDSAFTANEDAAYQSARNIALTQIELGASKGEGEVAYIEPNYFGFQITRAGLMVDAHRAKAIVRLNVTDRQGPYFTVTNPADPKDTVHYGPLPPKGYENSIYAPEKAAP